MMNKLRALLEPIRQAFAASFDVTVNDLLGLFDPAAGPKADVMGWKRTISPMFAISAESFSLFSRTTGVLAARRGKARPVLRL